MQSIYISQSQELNSLELRNFVESVGLWFSFILYCMKYTQQRYIYAWREKNEVERNTTLEELRRGTFCTNSNSFTDVYTINFVTLISLCFTNHCVLSKGRIAGDVETKSKRGSIVSDLCDSSTSVAYLRQRGKRVYYASRWNEHKRGWSDVTHARRGDQREQ